MSYTKTQWNNDQAPAINATNLNKIEQGIFNNDALLSSIMNTLGIDTQTWVSTDSYVEGQVVVYNNQLYKNITGNYTTTPPDEDTTNWSLTNMKDMQYPVGKVEIFYDTLDHSNYMGFTWERTAIGKVPVGIDSNDTDFNAIGKTGGSKYLQAHNHGGYTSQDPAYNTSQVYSAGGSTNFNALTWGGSLVGSDSQYRDKTIHRHTISTDGTGNSGNLQPYEVFAIWKRIS